MSWSQAAKFLTILPSFCRLLPHNRIVPRTPAQSYKKAQKSYKSRKVLPFSFPYPETMPTPLSPNMKPVSPTTTTAAKERRRTVIFIPFSHVSLTLNCLDLEGINQ
ncbi:hypothetical protein CEXT_549861 [Caerostris extrusa]|uniref:Uncharacterized protein n=1 Tax=Caerostris extrusa TaxID=172846 RepID=A0AAV4SBD5_CAEEX|nr:hypothetical protein CEXT_549861 [Caerostris extrusa]